MIRREIGVSDLTNGLSYDLIFLTFFLFGLEFRLINPVITNFSEQFMDHAFLASIIRLPVIPPFDPWFSGGDLSIYYYAGHWLFAMLSLISNVPSTVSFNLILPTVFGLSAVSLYMIGKMFLRQYQFLPLITLVFLHPAIIWYISQGQNIWIALNSTRWIINGCITEYPLFSLFLGDIHTHVLGLFNQFFLLSLLLFTLIKWTEMKHREQLILILITAVSLGFMAVCNSWDIPVYSLLILATGMILYLRTEKESCIERMKFFLVIPMALLLWSPVLIHMNTGAFTGIGLIDKPIDPMELILYVGIFILIFLLFLKDEFKTSPFFLIIPILFLATGYEAAAILSLPICCLTSHLIRSGNDAPSVYSDILGIAGFLTLLLCSIFRVSLESDASSMNTIFKIGYVSWVIISIASFLYIGHYLDNRGCVLTPRCKRIGTVLCVIGLLAAPIITQVDLGKSLFGLGFSGGYYTLDGLAYLPYAHPDDYKAIEYVKTLPSGLCILEGIGGDYSYSAPISSFTGIQTVLGKFSHEFQWRGSRYGWMPDRATDVKNMYEEPYSLVSLLKKYNVTHVYVGEIEKSLYNVSLPMTNLEPVWIGNDSVLYRVTDYEERKNGIWT